MEMILLVIAVGTAVYFGIRCFLIKQGICRVKQELEEIAEQLDENRITKLAVPQKELEQLLIVMNRTLEKIREERISYEKREKAFRCQIENISHDLRTPLTAIQGYLKMLDPEHLNSEDREALEVIQRRTDNLQYLINQFYEYSILISDDYKMELQEVDAGRLCREMLLGSYQRLEEQGIEVQAEIPERPVLIWADEHAMERIMGNLLQNAVRYAKSTLQMELSESVDKIELIFANDTDAVNAETLQQIFERFYTGNQARNEGGTGLGLTISKHLTEMMDGTLTAEMRGNWLIFHMCFHRKENEKNG